MKHSGKLKLCSVKVKDWMCVYPYRWRVFANPGTSHSTFIFQYLVYKCKVIERESSYVQSKLIYVHNIEIKHGSLICK